MVPKILNINKKNAVGLKRRTGMDRNNIIALWQAFMPHLNKIEGRRTEELIALQDFSRSNPQNPTEEFDIWALAEIKECAEYPETLFSYTIPSGSYAVFLLRGTDVQGLMKYIMDDWLPSSKYDLDQSRPHFQIMGAKYKNNHPGSEEDFYIPVTLK